MPKFTLNRDKTVVGLNGRSIEFVKGEATHVPPDMIADVVAIGAVPEDDAVLNEPEVAKAPQGDERKLLIRTAMEDMVATNIREDFTASGAPHNKKLSDRVGFAVDARERDAVWAELREGA